MSTQAQNHYLNYLIDADFQRANDFWCYCLKKKTNRTGHSNYFWEVEIKDQSVMIDDWILFDQLVKNNRRTHETGTI